jgi:eukaryotic-like serine/threonine-protein kinase
VEPFARIEQIFHEALQHDASQRAAFVRQACGSDSGLQREVLSLLANHDAEDALEPWASDAAARLIDSESLQSGDMLGPYRIDSFVAAGGMGKIYRATDTRLDRSVAIKISAARFSERFEREAKVIAALNHPHICQLYDVGPNYLVMEFVEGSPLRGPLPLTKVLEYAGQILDAVNAAHRKGIAHRDLKPDNILITRQGIKLLDFGLAKQSGVLANGKVALEAGLTRRSEILGTLHYMSPEQLQGKEIDARSDIFSFGCVLYEMLSGRQAFEGESAASTIAAIVEGHPADISIAPPLKRVIQTCLAKDPDRRFQNALDVKLALSWAGEQPPTPAETPPKRRWITPLVALVVVGGFAGGWLVSQFAAAPADNRVIRFQLLPPAGETVNGGPSGGAAVSPDGRSVAFTTVSNGQSGLWVRALDGDSARLLPGTEGATRPFWSPDGRSVAFAAGSALQQIDLSRQKLSRICDVNGTFNGGAWLDDGRILFANRNVGIFQVAATGGVPSAVALLDPARGDVTYADPHVFSGGRLLYTVQSQESIDIYAAPLSKPFDRTRLVRNGRNADVARAGRGREYLLWLSGETLVAQELDREKLQLTGEPRVVADHASLASSGGGTLLFGSAVAVRQFEWRDRAGKEVGTVGPPNAFVFNRLSPDGRRIATIRSGANADIWVLETERNTVDRLTAGHGIHINPVWSPDGRTILFSFGAPFNIFRVGADGAAAEERVTQSPENQYISDWSHDGRFILFGQVAGDTGSDIWSLEIAPDGKPSPGASPRAYIRAPFNQREARFSPDDRWVAYESDDSGQAEVYVQGFPDARERLHVSTGGGRFPEWGGAGRELYYVSKSGKLMVVDLKFGERSVQASVPRELFAVEPAFAGAPYEAAPDGRRFLTKVARNSSEPLNVIVNWPALMSRTSGQ